MTKPELKAKIDELTRGAQQRVNQLQTSDAILQGILSQRKVYEEWLASLSKDEGGGEGRLPKVPPPNGAAKKDDPVEAPEIPVEA